MSDNIDIEQAIQQIRTVLAENPQAVNLNADEVRPLIYRSIVTGNIAVQNGTVVIGDHNYIINLALEQIRIRAIQHPVPPIDRIVGRERELNELALQMGDGPTTNIVSPAHSTAVFGVAGIGKSTLATLYYHRFRDHYAQVYWRDLSKDSLISGLVHAIASIIGENFDPREVPNEDNQALLLVSWLRKLPEPYLIVLDDCETVLDDEGKAKPGWNTLFEQDSLGKCKLLVTSRQHIKAGRRRVHNYQIEGLNETDGLALLYDWGLVDADEILLKEAVTKASGHPLALILLAQLVVEDHLVLTDLLAKSHLWEKEVARNLLNEVYKRLSIRQKQLIRYISVYDRPGQFRQAVSPTDVAGTLIYLERQSLQEPDQDGNPKKGGHTKQVGFIQETKPEFLNGWKPDDIQEYALVLSRRGLLNAEGGRYTMHTIVRDYAYRRLTRRASHHLAAAAYWKAQYTRDSNINPPHSLSDVQPLLDAFDQLCAGGDYQNAANLLYGTQFEYINGDLFIALNILLLRWSEFSRIQAMLERLVNAPVGALRDRSRAAAFGNLGVVYRILGEYDKAIEYNSRHLNLTEQIGDHQGQADALSNLGSAYYSLGMYDKAIDYHNRHLKMAEQIGDHQGQAGSFGNLGSVYKDLGEYEKASDYYSRQLEIAVNIGDNRGHANALSGLGIVYKSLGEYDKAIDYHNRHLNLAEQLGDRLSQASALGNLGEVYRNLGEYVKAIDYYSRALKIDEQIGDVAGQGNAWNNLGAALYSLKRYCDALVCYFKAMTLRERLGNPHRIETTRNNIAEIRATMDEAAWPQLQAEARWLADDSRWHLPAV